jgi:hypothetical protein
MIHNRTPAEVLSTGIAQALTHRAPADMVSRLTGALAFVNAAPDTRKPASAVVVESVPPPDSVVVQDA